MNVFVPYAARTPTHEDQLTRAFLIVLRAVPIAHMSWLRLLDGSHRAAGGTGIPGLDELPTPEVETQTGRVPDGITRLISVLQTDEHYFAGDDVGRSERSQVLDGLITYAPDLALAVENKPFVADVREDQLSVNVPAEMEHDAKLAAIRWAAIVQSWNRLLDNNLLAPAESVLIADFLDFVEEHFELLMPYSRIRSCATSTARLRRRCRRLLEEIAGGEEHVHPHRGWSHYIRLDAGQPATQVALMPAPSPEPSLIRLEIDPGDTTSQARVMFERVLLANLRSLTASGWSIRPNPHLSYRASNLLWTQCRLTLEDYWAFWTSDTGRKWLRQVKREEFDDLFDLLVRSGIAAETDRAAFDLRFSDSKRNNLNVCPGLTLRYEMKLGAAAELDDRDALASHLAEHLKVVATQLELRLPSSDSAGPVEHLDDRRM